MRTKTTKLSHVHKTLNFDNSVEKNLLINLLIIFSKMDGLSNDFAQKTLYDEYIDQPKLTELRNQNEHIIPPLLSWVRTITEEAIDF